MTRAAQSGGASRKVTTQRVPVVFDARVAGSLVGHLASAINGSAIARKTSFLKDKLGERLFAPGIRIVDDPLRPRGLRSHPFDAEGVAVERRHHIFSLRGRHDLILQPLEDDHRR